MNGAYCAFHFDKKTQVDKAWWSCEIRQVKRTKKAGQNNLDAQGCGHCVQLIDSLRLQTPW